MDSHDKAVILVIIISWVIALSVIISSGWLLDIIYPFVSFATAITFAFFLV